MSDRRPLTPAQQAERSLITKYRKQIWDRFIGGVKDYALIQEGDKIAVCISGGKDSMLLALCLRHLQRYTEVPFTLEFLVLDPGYSPENRARVLQNAALLQLPVRIFGADIFSTVDAQESGSPCYLCARMRRGFLYKYARSLGCNKIALGHHFNDVIETILMSTLYGAQARTMMPKLHSKNFSGMELIRPLYLVRETDIIAWARYNSLEFIRCACRITEELPADEAHASKRAEVKALIAALCKGNPQVDSNIFRSVESVNLETVIGWYNSKHRHSFLDDYENKIT